MLALLTTNCPDLAMARAIAADLLDARLVAAANIHAEIESHYVWQDTRIAAREVPLVLNTRLAVVPQIEARLGTPGAPPVRG